MRFVRIIFYFAIFVFCTNCQIIEFPEDSPKSNNNDVENIDDKTNPDNNSIKPNTNNATNIQPVFSRPTDGFSQDNSLKLTREFPFTNYDSQGFANPFYTVLKFLESIRNNDSKLLTQVSVPELFNTLNIRNDYTPDFWCYMQGIVGLYNGISRFYRISDKLYFDLQTISESSYTSIILSLHEKTWLVSNVSKVVATKKLKSQYIYRHSLISIIWQGFWNIDSVETYRYILSKPKLTRFDLLTKILIDARDNINSSASATYLSSEYNDLIIPDFMRKTVSVIDSKSNENQFMVNFYKSSKLTDLIAVEKYPVSENFQIETYVAIFDIKINPAVFVRWFVYNGTPYLEKFELPTGSNLQISFITN